jgi:hypothetical protein
MRPSSGLLSAVRRAVHGPDVENRRGPMMADDPNGRMKAARDAMNKTIAFSLKFGRLDSPRAGRWGLPCPAESRSA